MLQGQEAQSTLKNSKKNLMYVLNTTFKIYIYIHFIGKYNNIKAYIVGNKLKHRAVLIPCIQKKYFYAPLGKMNINL